MGWVFDESVTARAGELAEQLVAGLADRVPQIRDFMALARAVAGLEAEFERARQNLKGMHLRGIASPTDYAGFENLRKNLHATQIRFVRLVRRLFEDQPEALRRIPRVQKPPAISQAVSGYTLPANAGAGLGAVQAAAIAPAAAAALPAWMVGAIILALIAAAILVVVAVIVTVVATAVLGGLAAESLRDITLTHQQLEAHTNAQQERLAVFERCLDALGAEARTDAEARTRCRLEAVALVPEPPIVAAEIPRPGDWVPWLVGGALGLAVIGGGLYIYSVQKGMRALSGSTQTYNVTDPTKSRSYRSLTPSQVLSEEDRFSLDIT